MRNLTFNKCPSTIVLALTYDAEVNTEVNVDFDEVNESEELKKYCFIIEEK